MLFDDDAPTSAMRIARAAFNLACPLTSYRWSPAGAEWILSAPEIRAIQRKIGMRVRTGHATNAYGIVTTVYTAVKEVR